MIFHLAKKKSAPKKSNIKYISRFIFNYIYEIRPEIRPIN